MAGPPGTGSDAGRLDHHEDDTVFDRHLESSEPPRIRLHDLRHTHATILLKSRRPVKVVSERLGYSNPAAFTMTVYQHVLPGMQADAAKLVGEAVYGPTRMSVRNVDVTGYPERHGSGRDRSRALPRSPPRGS